MNVRLVTIGQSPRSDVSDDIPPFINSKLKTE